MGKVSILTRTDILVDYRQKFDRILDQAEQRVARLVGRLVASEGSKCRSIGNSARKGSVS